MAIKVGNVEVISDSAGGKLSSTRLKSYSAQDLANKVVVGSKVGDFVINATDGGFSFWDGERWDVLSGVNATGGTIETPGDGYRYHFFNNYAGQSTPVESQFEVAVGGDIEFIVVGGGGAGGSYRGAGGGAGGLNSNWPDFPGFYGGTPYSVSAGTYPVIVGGGGTDPGGPGGGGRGYDSVFNGAGVNGGNPITGSGGGGGAGADGNSGGHSSGNPGGSGGGGRDNTSSSGTGFAGQSVKTTGEIGNPGGQANVAYGGAGGGGAGGVGGNMTGPGSASGTGPSLGGIGWGFNGVPLSYGTSGPDNTKRYFAGGGGGHIYPNGYANGGYGGGGAASGTGRGTQGVNGTGGGGGGGGQNSPLGGDGGKGIVIIRYLV